MRAQLLEGPSPRCGGPSFREGYAHFTALPARQARAVRVSPTGKSVSLTGKLPAACVGTGRCARSWPPNPRACHLLEPPAACPKGFEPSCRQVVTLTLGNICSETSQETLR